MKSTVFLLIVDDYANEIEHGKSRRQKRSDFTLSGREVVCLYGVEGMPFMFPMFTNSRGEEYSVVEVFGRALDELEQFEHVAYEEHKKGQVGPSGNS
jgi:hypothetical protein